jgi:1-acyl-sn-glycerol-3-phosphate acyltransferase
VLQRLGLFSVERGARDAPAKRYAIDVVKAHKNVMVIFPEGEIFYLNESVQPFHSGAIDIGMRAIVESRNVQPDWTAYIIPMAIKYTYNQPMQRILDQRVRRMEVRLAQHAIERELHKRIDNLLTDVVKNEESKHNIQQSDSERMKALSDRLKSARHAILASIEQKHTAMYNAQSRTIDRAWQLGAHLRQKMESRKFSHTQQLQIRNDIQDLREVAELTSFRPEYWESSSSTDRLAEVILKLEREIFQIKRPHQLARRDVYIRIGEPIDLGQFLAAYQEDPHSLRHKLAEQLRTTVQLHIDEVAQKV